MDHPGKLMRDRAVSIAMKRKEEYLGARVPKELRDRVIHRAKELGIPVSILIRNILEDAFRNEPPELQAIAATRHGKVGDRFSSVLGWESIKLNRPIDCSGCGVPLTPGDDVTLGLGAGEPVVLCDICKDRI